MESRVCRRQAAWSASKGEIGHMHSKPLGAWSHGLHSALLYGGGGAICIQETRVHIRLKGAKKLWHIKSHNKLRGAKRRMRHSAPWLGTQGTGGVGEKKPGREAGARPG